MTESSHWDHNWLFTSQQYFRYCVRRTLDRAIEALLLEPRRVFSLECAFFPDMYWERPPDQRTVFRKLVHARPHRLPVRLDAQQLEAALVLDAVA